MCDLLQDGVEPLIWIQSDKEQNHLILVPILKNKALGFIDNNFVTITNSMVKSLNQLVKQIAHPLTNFAIKGPQELLEFQPYFSHPLPTFFTATIVCSNFHLTMEKLQWLELSPEKSKELDDVFNSTIFTKKIFLTTIPSQNPHLLFKKFSDNNVQASSKIEQLPQPKAKTAQDIDDKISKFSIQKLVMVFSNLSPASWEKHTSKGRIFTILSEEEISQLRNILKVAVYKATFNDGNEKMNYLIELESNREEALDSQTGQKILRFVCSHDLLVKLYGYPKSSFVSAQPSNKVSAQPKKMDAAFFKTKYVPSLLIQVMHIFKNDTEKYLSFLTYMRDIENVRFKNLVTFMWEEIKLDPSYVDSSGNLNEQHNNIRAIMYLRQLLRGEKDKTMIPGKSEGTKTHPERISIDMTKEEIKIGTYSIIQKMMLILQNTLNLQKNKSATQNEELHTEQNEKNDLKRKDSVSEDSPSPKLPKTTSVEDEQPCEQPEEESFIQSFLV